MPSTVASEIIENVLGRLWDAHAGQLAEASPNAGMADLERRCRWMGWRHEESDHLAVIADLDAFACLDITEHRAAVVPQFTVRNGA
nr:hypothetical protein [Haloechinothrix sp. LS1_15]